MKIKKKQKLAKEWFLNLQNIICNYYTVIKFVNMCAVGCGCDCSTSSPAVTRLTVYRRLKVTRRALCSLRVIRGAGGASDS